MAALVQWLAFSGARNVDGTPIASGRAYFYVPGTASTQVVVYSDKDGLAAVTQPVTLDASGRAEVYSKTPVKVSVQDATTAVVKMSDRGNTVNASQVEIEQAGITGTSLTTGLQVDGGRTDLSTMLGTLASGFGANFSYLESATATSRTYASAIGWAVTPQDFGALGNNSADDTAAFQAAINRAIASHKPLLIPTGTYRIYSALSVSGTGASGFRMFGASRATSVILNMNTGAQAIAVYAPAGSSLQTVSFENFTIGHGSPSGSSDAAIFINQGDEAVIVGVTAWGHRTGMTSSATSVTMQDCVSTSFDVSGLGYGFVLGPGGRALRCFASRDSGTGFYLSQGSSAHLCSARAIGGTGFAIAGFSAVASQCAASQCTAGFGVGAVDGSGCISCLSTDASVSDFGTNAAATAVVDSGNTFTTRTPGEAGGSIWQGPRAQILSRKRSSLIIGGGSSATFTPDLTKGELQVVVVGETSGSPATLVIAAPAVVQGVVDGQALHFVIENNGPGTLTITWNPTYRVAAYFSAATPGALPTLTLLSIRFIWRELAGWVPLPWTSAAFTTANAGYAW